LGDGVEFAAKSDLRASSETHANSPQGRFVRDVRGQRAAELRRLLSQPDQLSLEVFNREVRRLDGGILLDGQPVAGAEFFSSEISADRAEELSAALRAGRLELHGNCMWGSGTKVYGAQLKIGDAEKTDNIRRAAGFLNSGLSPTQKVRVGSIAGGSEQSARTERLVRAIAPLAVARCSRSSLGNPRAHTRRQRK
jgi:hypothetical protein